MPSNLDDIALARRTIPGGFRWMRSRYRQRSLTQQRIYGARLTPAEAVDRIIKDVRERGDAALTIGVHG